MQAKVVSAEFVAPCVLSDVPDGDYPGVWGGYVVEVVLEGLRHRLTTDVGIRGMNASCVVRVLHGKATIETCGAHAER